MSNKKIIFIPGWMNGPGMYGKKFSFWEPWKNRVDPKEKIEAEYIIGHSVGANYALYNWEINRNAKVILVNPLLPKRNILAWFWRWVKFQLGEIKPKEKEIISGIKNKIYGIKLCLKLLEKDFDETLSNIPRENLWVICGKEDIYYCDKKFRDYMKKKEIKLIEVEEARHDWKKDFEREIEKIISND